MNKWICCTSWCFWIPLTLSWIARCIAVPDFAIHLWYYTTDILTFVICTMSSSWDMIQRWSRTRLGRKYVNLDTLSPLQGVVDGHNRLSDDLQHIGTTTDQGLQMPSHLLTSRQQFFQSVESQQEEWMAGVAQKHEGMMKGMAKKHKFFWDSMRSQLAEEDRAIAAIKHRWDYQEGALRAQHDQLLTKQETLGPLYTSTPVEEGTHLEHPIEGVPGGVSAGGTSFQENSASRRSQPWRSVMMHANLIPLTQCTDTPYQEAGLQECHRNASDQMGTGYPFRDSVDPSQYRITRSPHHQEELTELGQDAQSLLISLDWNHQYRN